MVDLVLRRANVSGRRVKIIYLNQNNQITQRWIKIFSMNEEKVKAYCYLRQAPRWFDRHQILAAE
ncbi:hypothetical protein [Hazenella coriacea]|uniref:WYL domain-containing protein n=1 Tax=Hazenella coriacea TaxID=1179467 RepID=A0A4R3L6I7_9BACL|nr:hypothetical protein [Hazenella coriacea]TCS93156.1 hypothetical protein EDD58_10998 [Hazenella coriacea]